MLSKTYEARWQSPLYSASSYSVLIVTGDSKTLVGRLRPASDVTKKTLCVTPPTGILMELDDADGGGRRRRGLSRAQRSSVTSKTEACPYRRCAVVVGEGPARYTYLRSGDINKC